MRESRAEEPRSDGAVQGAQYVRPVEVVTRTGNHRHAAYVPDDYQGNEWAVPSKMGVCGRAKSSKSLIRVSWLEKCGERPGPPCRACWRRVASDEGVTA